MQRVGNSRSQSSSDRHGKKCRIQTMPIGKPEANIGSTAGGIYLQLFPQALDDVHHLATRGIDGANRHYQRVYNNIRPRNAMIRCPFHNFLCYRVTNIRIFRDAGFVVGDGDDSRFVFLDQRQHGL